MAKGAAEYILLYTLFEAAESINPSLLGFVNLCNSNRSKTGLENYAAVACYRMHKKTVQLFKDSVVTRSLCHR
ncbi:hypothetical protein BKA63DRAFT_525192 [Paraphoma chrysanthemicola]|nr:hypothetical protein BKA63DRAFT_525192 [Paraphoma chrysanthemicola]